MELHLRAMAPAVAAARGRFHESVHQYRVVVRRGIWSGSCRAPPSAPECQGVEVIEFLPLVKAYPALSRTYGEVCCVAGVQMTAAGPQWIRLYPVPFRSLQDRQQFRKYQRIRLRVTKHRGDRRPETRRPDRDSIEPFGTPIPSSDAWGRRRRWVEPLMAESMCEVRRRQRVDGTSLAVFRPADVQDLQIEDRDIDADRRALARAKAAQGSLLDAISGEDHGRQLRELEEIPHTFKYRYLCGEQGCRGHLQTIIDWEIVQFYRQVRHGKAWRKRMRERWLHEICSAQRDTAFFVGNQHQHPGSFMILGVWWPPLRGEQLELANLGDV